MKRGWLRVTSIVALATMLVSCATMTERERQRILGALGGAVFGAGAGAIATKGRSPEAILGGALAGAAAGWASVYIAQEVSAIREAGRKDEEEAQGYGKLVTEEGPSRKVEQCSKRPEGVGGASGSAESIVFGEGPEQGCTTIKVPGPPITRLTGRPNDTAVRIHAAEVDPRRVRPGGRITVSVRYGIVARPEEYEVTVEEVWTLWDPTGKELLRTNYPLQHREPGRLVTSTWIDIADRAAPGVYSVRHEVRAGMVHDEENSTFEVL